MALKNNKAAEMRVDVSSALQAVSSKSNEVEGKRGSCAASRTTTKSVVFDDKKEQEGFGRGIQEERKSP